MHRTVQIVTIACAVAFLSSAHRLQADTAPIGNASGTLTTVEDGFDMTARGTNIAGIADQFFFNYQEVTNDFDFKIRVATFTGADVWARAGLMARETLTTNSRYAAALVTPNVFGAIFQQRATAGGNTTFAGSAPVNYPYTWLRLARAGNIFTAYSGLDGQTWQRLGSVTNAMPATIYFGVAAASGSSNTTASLQFRDYMSGAGGTVASTVFDREPLGPSPSRRTGLVISEIHYHPQDRPDARQTEFIEIYNTQSIFEDITGYRLSGDVDFTFPTNTVLQPGQFIVLAKVASDLHSIYQIPASARVFEYGVTNGFITNIVNGITNVTADIVNSLDNISGTLRLRGRADQVLLEVDFDSNPPWPIEADGAGHSLVLARPSYGEGDPRAWAPSDVFGGSPGTYDTLAPEPARNIVINEILAHTDAPLEDYVELYNHGTASVDLSGFWLSERANPAETNKYQIAGGTVLGPREFIHFTETQLGFALSAQGEKIFLINSNENRIIDAVEFEAQANGVASGRYPDGAPGFRDLAIPTPGTTNAPLLEREIVINEIMYNPITGDNDDEFVELYNRSGAPVNVGGWRFTAGIDFRIPPNTIIQPGGYLVVARDAAHLTPKYNNLGPNNLVGDYDGSLANAGERVALAMPEDLVSTNSSGAFVTNIIYVVVNEVTYGSRGRWGYWSDGGGSSLELLDPQAENRLSANWADSDESNKSTWAGFENKGPIDHVQSGQGANGQLQMFMLGIGECLIDDVEVHAGAANANLVPNSSFENGQAPWVLQGSHDQSVIHNEGYSGTRSLRIRAQSRGDNGANRIRTALSGTATSPATLQAKARWLRGFPEVLLRLHGGGLEAFGRLHVPGNLGSPGALNSRAVTNAGPAIYDVAHSPALPQASEAVRVTARVSDPDGISQFVVRYRPDPGSTFSSATLADNGIGADAVAGDGLFTATIPGQNAGVMIAFYVEAVDGTGVTNVFPENALVQAFPNDSPSHLALIRWGEVQMPGSFATYHIWITAATATRWTLRDRLNNSQLDATFVYNNYRVVYNMKPQYAGSPWHNGQMTGPLNQSSRQDYVMNLPEDAKVLGNTDFVLNTPGNPGGNDSSDPSAMSEQISYEIFKGIHVHYNYRRYIHLFLNGFQRSIRGSALGSNFIMEDSQQPNGDVVREWWPDDTEGELFKIEDWFEFNDVATGFSNDDADLTRRQTTYNGVPTLDIAPYRFMWRKRSLNAGDSANNYTNFFAVVDTVSPASTPSVSPLPDAMVKRLAGIVDFEQWMRIFAVQHTVGNWDAYGYDRGKNAYMYRPTRGMYGQMTWDIDFTLNVGGHSPTTDLFGCNDPRVVAMYSTPEIRRALWRAYKDIINGPLNNAYLNPMMDARAAAFRANNINFDANVMNNSIKTFVIQRRNYISNQLNGVTANWNVVNTNFTISSNLAVITGTAPIDVKFIDVDGVPYPITWTGVTAWTLRIPLDMTGSNAFMIEPRDRLGRPLTNFNRSVVVNYTGGIVPPQGNIVFNEIMFDPLIPGSEYVELANRSTNFSFDISGWRINGLDYTFPEGSILPARGFLVLTRDQAAFASAYGGTVSVFGQFNGQIQTDGETFTLIKPGAAPEEDEIIDRVRYDGALPWPEAARGTGSAIQLIDNSQENARAGNWFADYVPPIYSEAQSTPAQTNDGWRFASLKGNAGTVGRVLIYLNERGSAIIDDVMLVAGTNAGVGYNYVRNGDFEMMPLLEDPPLTNSWLINTNYTNTSIISSLVHSGSGALRLECSVFGNTLTRVIYQNLDPAPTNLAVHTLSFWYWATNSATNINVRLQSSQLTILTNIQISITPSNYTPPQIVRQATNTLSPGAVNQRSAALPPFPNLWINELQLSHSTGLADNQGQRDPWIEIYNAGSSVESLEGLFLASNYTNLTEWAFPAGSTINPGEFKVVFVDGQPGQSSGSELHAGFRLPDDAGSIALSRLYNGSPQVLDYVNYQDIHSDRSYGSFGDGQPFDRMEFFYVTPGAPNDGRSAPLVVFINEWMADNDGVLQDEADLDFDDWFELYNPNAVAVDLAGYYLTDVLTNKTKYLITTNGPHVIPAGGHLLVWADNETGQNTQQGVPRSDLHVNFQLSAEGEAIGLFAADGTQIDAVTFGAQTTDASEGRVPDGAATIQRLDTPSPRGANSGGSTEPAFSAITLLGNQVTLRWNTVAGTIYRVLYKDDFTAGTWTPLAPDVPGDGNPASVSDSITASPQRFYRLQLNP